MLPRNGTKVTLLASTISAILSGSAAHRAVAQEAGAVEEVVVTGSRIVRRDFEASTPIMTVDAERLEATSTLSVESVLNQMPQFAPAQSQFSAQGQIQTSPTASLGVGTVNLRGVGTNRTLVLIDGRRAQPANASLVVDLNTVPSAAIERVETITGGASAVYGADALAGVVNFVLKDDFEGVSIDAQSSMTEAGDGHESRFSSLIGLNSSSGNANMLLGVEWYERDIAYQKNRDFYRKAWNDPTDIRSTFLPSMAAYNIDPNNRPTQAAIDALFPQYAPGTVNVNSAVPPVIYFHPETGAAWTRNAQRALGFDDSLLGRPDIGDGYYGLIRQGDRIEQIYQDGPLSTPLERRSAFAKGHVDITDNLRAFVQANYSGIKVDTFSAGPPPAYNTAWGGAIPNDGRTSIPPGLQTLLDSRPNPDETWFLTRGLDFVGQFGPTNDSSVYQITAGLEGSFENRDWTWEAFYSSGKTTATNVYYGLPSVQRWKALVASPEFGRNQVIDYLTGPDGNPVLDENGERIPIGGGEYLLQCTSGLPIFYGTTAETTQDCINSIIGPFKSAGSVSQDILEANLQGKLADMRSGELRFAAGISNRKNGFVYEPANASSALFDFPLGIFASNSARGETEVWEIYGEMLLPVTERFDISLGYRYSDYQDGAVGEVGTYKAEFDWQANDWMRMRAAYQVANRAPNTAELFQSETNQFQGTFSSADPCASTTLIPGFGNRADNPNRLQVQELCAQLIVDFPTPGTPAADTWMEGTVPFTGINAILTGNPNLKSEEAETWTFGFVFSAPGGIDGLTASVDFYDISITGAIATFDGQAIYDKCFNRDGRSNPNWSINDPGGFCALIDRSDGAGTANGIVHAPYLNTGFIETSGVDVAVNWAKDLAGGTFYINNLMTFLNEFKTQASFSDPVLEHRDTLSQGGQFKHRLYSTFGYRFGGGNASVGLRWRYLPEVKNAAYVTNPSTDIFPTKSYSVFDLFGSYAFNERYQIRGGIDNVFDTDPAVVGARPTDSNSGSTNTGYYDVLGPRLYVGLKIDF